MKKDDIKKAILQATGNPSSGVIVEFVDVIADEIMKLNKNKFEPPKEIRVVEPKESRDINY